MATHKDDDNINHRSILFVAHSLGGLVCEDLIVHVHLIIEAIAGIKDAVQALLASRNRTEKPLQNILSCTRGILFLGTSHGGFALATWAELLAKSVGLTNPQIIDVLERDSEVLARIQKDFHSMLRARADDHDPSIAITFFYEQLPLPGIDDVVPKDSAILPAYKSIGIHDYDMGMAKFEAANDPGSNSVAGELQRWVRKLKPMSGE
ncbi:hypothetical protein MMC22_008067 [Lobaria immixta]|nr:hypothetical protein [Lobaria immixta]